MAAVGNSGSITTTLMQRIDGELICGICLELFKSPVMLMCGHNFCKECVYGMIENGMNFSFISIGPPRSLNCPICQAAISINKVTHDGLMSNKALESIVELYKNCSPVDVFDSSWNTDIEMSPTECRSHNKPEDRFCDSCNVSICSHCERFDHQSSKAKHRVSSLRHAAISYQTEVADVLTKLKKELIPLNDKIARLENILSRIQGKQEHINKNLDQQISLLMSLIRQQQDQLKSTLDTVVQARQQPVLAELDKCHAVNTNVQELMKKLSNIRNTKNPTLQLKLMKDTCVQLRSVLSFDISERLGNFDDSDTEFLSWNIDTDEIIDAIGKLDWKYETPGKDRRGNYKDTGIQTEGTEESCEEHKKNKNKKGKLKKSPLTNRYDLGSKSPDIRSGREEFDEIDGDFLDFSKNVEHGAKSVKIKEIVPNGDKEEAVCVKEIKLKQADKSPFTSGDNDTRETFETPKMEYRLKTKGRSSFPMESALSLNDSSVTERTQNPAMKNKKSYSDKDLNKGGKSDSHSPSNAEVLAKFVARRRTMSPSVSSPSLKTLDISSSKLEKSEPKTRKNASSPTLKSLLGKFSETKDRKDEDSSAPSPPVNDIPENLMPKGEEPEILKSEINIKDTNVKDNTKSLKKLPNDSPKLPNDSPKLPNDSLKEGQDNKQNTAEESASQNETGSVKDSNVSHHPKPFSKQPIGMNLDLHLGDHIENSKDESKRVTEV